MGTTRRLLDELDNGTYAPFEYTLLDPWDADEFRDWWNINVDNLLRARIFVDSWSQPKINALEGIVVDKMNRFLSTSTDAAPDKHFYLYLQSFKEGFEGVCYWKCTCVQELRNIFSPFNLKIPGRKAKNALILWNQDNCRRHIKAFIFNPGLEAGLAEHKILRKKFWFYNSWCGYNTEISNYNPVGYALRHPERLRRFDDVSPELTEKEMEQNIVFHLKYIMCRGDDRIFQWVWKWMQHCVRFPHKKLPTTLVFTGCQGSGKTYFWEQFSKIFGRHGLNVPDANLLIHKFGGEQICKRVFLVANEIDYTGISRGQLKNLITNNTLQVEQKKDHIRIEPAYFNMVWTSNDKVPLQLERGSNRRFLLVNTAEDKVGDHHYFNTLVKSMHEPGMHQLFRKLTLARDVEALDPQLLEAPLTEEKCIGIAETFDEFENFWIECLRSAQHVPVNNSGIPPDRATPFWFKRVDKRGQHGIYFKFYDSIHSKGKKGHWTETRFFRALQENLPNPPPGLTNQLLASFDMPSLDACRRYFFMKTCVPCGREEPSFIPFVPHIMNFAEEVEARKEVIAFLQPRIQRRERYPENSLATPLFSSVASDGNQ